MKIKQFQNSLKTIKQQKTKPHRILCIYALNGDLQTVHWMIFSFTHPEHILHLIFTEETEK